ncbi:MULTISPECIES: hypothetical protein [unclassified Crossiella]|uniref:hypothetical protein n=1 Tax=unclassified Crossiella TaxID=2620835 RepID=UPI001FFF06F4|nr:MULTISPECIES: hypothetical protein [unclassified Crossiella]MCK2240676.1 hypothetical protein [Crossiella sp. S99.2]MCK2252873.1 hypothetical protein [Crossiella sp. S99.1]
MNEQLLAQLTQLQDYATKMQTLMSSAEASAPRLAEGTDATGLVQVTVGPEGLPASFRVDNAWACRIRPEAFGSTVLEAFQAAISQRMASWSDALVSDGWKDQLDRLKAAPVDVAGPGQAPTGIRTPRAAESPRPLDVITEDVLKAFNNLDSFTPSTDDTNATGTDRSGKLALVLSPTGLVSCTAEERWVADQTATRLMNALGEALASAKEALRSQQNVPPANPAGGMDNVVAEVMALLNNPHRLAD